MIKFLPEDTLLGTHQEGEEFSYTITAVDEVETEAPPPAEGEEPGEPTTTQTPVCIDSITSDSPYAYNVTMEIQSCAAVITGPATDVFPPQSLKYIPVGEITPVAIERWGQLPAVVQHMTEFVPASNLTKSIYFTASTTGASQTYEIIIRNDWTAGKLLLEDAVNNKEVKYSGAIE